MANWSKEDRTHFNNSEVMKEFEKMIIEKYTTLLKLQERIEKNAQDGKLKQVTTDATEASKALKNLNDEVSKLNLADDAKDEEEISVEVETAEEANEGGIVVDAFLDTIKHLEKMASKALDMKDYSSLYEIERTIQELKDGKDE